MVRTVTRKREQVLVGVAFALAAMGCHRHESPSPERVSLPVPSASAVALSRAPQATPDAGPPITHAVACPKKWERHLAPSEIPALEEKPVLLPLFRGGAEGKPRRVTLQFFHPIAGCECPSFGVDNYFPDEGPEMYNGMALDDWTFVVFPDGMPNGKSFEDSKYYGRTRYELTGYYSGRLVDSYGSTPEEIKRRAKPIKDEEYNPNELYPEFCVEDWCYRPDPDPGLYKDSETPAEIASDRAKYKSVINDMKRARAKRCPDPKKPSP